mmetsp:Transcript_25032/g.65265  ORF Transcript_25032/g.65265 Transcript_25032/m.65265 type:complete len:293 (+) Transcript_25032:2-880(+)
MPGMPGMPEIKEIKLDREDYQRIEKEAYGGNKAAMKDLAKMRKGLYAQSGNPFDMHTYLTSPDMAAAGGFNFNAYDPSAFAQLSLGQPVAAKPAKSIPSKAKVKKAAPAPAAAADGALPPSFATLKTTPFKREVDFPPVILSYQSHSTGKDLGKAWMWALVNEFKKHGIESFNGAQVEAGEDWVIEYIGALAEAKVLISMISKTYWKSAACMDELRDGLKMGKKVIHVFLEDAPADGHFLGETKDQINLANFVKTRLGNCFPPPDKGFFQGDSAEDFKHTAAGLVDIIKAEL